MSWSEGLGEWGSEIDLVPESWVCSVQAAETGSRLLRESEGA